MELTRERLGEWEAWVRDGGRLDEERTLALIAAARELEERRWVPVTERLPDAETPVLAFWRHHVDGGATDTFVAERSETGNWWLWPRKPGAIREVTHWMPLPKGPTNGR